jgi:hypothetical protein
VSEINRYQGGFAARAEAKAHSRGLARLGNSTGFGLARTESVTELQAFKVDAQAFVTKRGIEGAALIGSVARSAAEAVPEAAAGIAYIAQQGLVALGGIVTDTAYELRKIR